ncbi:MAG: S-methyl-5-thioribose-1-phosphate isomerase [bacterium]|nr:S-methyl-5-thioribose-1-phosphate isomerase [bacterium]
MERAEEIIMPINFSKPLIWKDGILEILDQRRLPEEVIWISCLTPEDVAIAIKEMAIRGAPAIGVAAGYGVALASNPISAIEVLKNTRPTAKNLFYALDKMKKGIEEKKDLLSLAKSIEAEEEKRCLKIAEYGLSLIKDGSSLLTHCNTGPLATAGIGTALGPILLAKDMGIAIKVFATETRPVRQGSRLTMWELKKADISAILIADTAVGYIMNKGLVDAVFVGADRIVKNGDTANKIGTYQIAVLARFHKIPFYVVAPSSTIDIDCPGGNKIVIEERPKKEVTTFNFDCLNPAFDVTPASLITKIITEDGIFEPQKITEDYRE